jgi:hypothetical protein
MSAQRSPFLTTYIAIAVLAALSGYLYFFDREHDPNAEERVFAHLDLDAIRAVTLSRADGETIRLERETGEEWRLVSPSALPADAATVRTLLSATERLTLDQVVEGGTDRIADFGLVAPRFTLSLEAEGGTETLRLELGNEAPGGEAVYARESGRADVLAVASSIATDFDKHAFDFRDRDVLHIERDAIDRLEISGPEGGFALAKTSEDEDAWVFTRPLSTPAGRWSVDGLVGLLAGLRMDAVAAEEADDLAAFGLDVPLRRIVIGLGAEQKILEIGSSPGEGQYHAREASSRLVAVIPGTLVDDLAGGMDALRATRLLEVSTFEVTGFTAQLAAERRSYTSQPGEGDDGAKRWTRSEPEPAELESTPVEDLLYDLGGLQVEAFVDTPGPDAQYGLDAPAATIRLTRRENSELEVVLGIAGESAWARRPGDDAILRLNAEKVGSLLEKLAGL